MSEDESKQEEKFEFTSEGETLGYISLDQARVLAMRTARETPGAYGPRFRSTPMAFEVTEENETEDHYVITLSFRPEGEFNGTPGREQFFISKEGILAVRQVLSLPKTEGGQRFPTLPAAVGGNGGRLLVSVVIAGPFLFVGFYGISMDSLPLWASGTICGVGILLMSIGLYMSLMGIVPSPSLLPGETQLERRNPTMKPAYARMAFSIPFFLVAGYLAFLTMMPYIYPTAIFLCGLFFFFKGTMRYMRNLQTNYYTIQLFLTNLKKV